ncbi:MAG: glycosyltransferase family 4 protein, partial [Verrucomicrobiota bacterium]|nr:glycosyltransferase family 4 protein [Verrucomicrobiota bacterium]
MKITIVLGAFFPVPPLMGGAVEKVWFALGQEFARQGHEVVQISRTHPELPTAEIIAGVRHVRVAGFAQPRSGVWLKVLDLIYSLRVRSVLPRADILVTNTFWLPMLVRGRDRGLLYIHVQRGPKGQMRFYSHAARLLAVSRAIAEAIIKEAPQLREKVRVIGNALPPRRTSDLAVKRERTILYVGRVHPEKGLEVLLGAWRRLPAGLVTGWRLRIVGPADENLGGGGKEFLARLQAIGSESAGEIDWVGPVFDEAELAAHYRSALLFIYPSIAETGEALPVAPLEAMSNGCAPVVSDLSCFRDYIEQNVTGFVFDHRASEAGQALSDR